MQKSLVYLIPLVCSGLFSDEELEDTHGPAAETETGAVFMGCVHLFFFMLKTNEHAPSEVSVELSEPIRLCLYLLNKIFFDILQKFCESLKMLFKMSTEDDKLASDK